MGESEVSTETASGELRISGKAGSRNSAGNGVRVTADSTCMLRQTDREVRASQSNGGEC